MQLLSNNDRLPAEIMLQSCKPQKSWVSLTFFQRDGLSLILPALYQQLLLPALYLCSLPLSSCTTIDYPKPQFLLSEGVAGSAALKFIVPLLQAIFLHCFFMSLHPFLTYVLPCPKFTFTCTINTSSLLVISIFTETLTSSHSFLHPISL